LNKYLAQCGVGSRRDCDRLIREGRVRINGTQAAELGTRVDPEKDRIELNGKAINPPRALRYVIFNKPKGVITSRDGQGAQTIYDICSVQLPYVGRLDKDTTGLLLLTNDGELANRLTHPRYKVEKTYLVTLQAEPTPQQMDLLRNGVLLEDGIASATRVKLLCKDPKGYPRLEVTIAEGRKRLVRRMMAQIGLILVELQRTRFGPLSLDLPIGKARDLTAGEIKVLRKVAGL